MAVKNVKRPLHLMVDGDMGGSITGTAFPITWLDNIGVQFVWTATGSPVGNFTLEATIDGTNWEDLGILIAAGGGAGHYLQSLNQMPFDKIRAKYTRSSAGTGALAQVWFMAKEV